MKILKTTKGANVYRILTGRSNSYLISTPENNILVDTGVSSSYKKLLSSINSLELNNNGIDFLILTHTHYDHCQSAAIIKQDQQCKIIFSENEYKYVMQGFTPMPQGTNFITKIISASGNRILWRRCCYRPFVGDVLLKDHFNFEDSCSDIRVIKTEGHSAGSISVIVDSEIAIVGDAMFGVYKNSVFPPFADNPKELIKSWKILLNTGCEIFLPGHGDKILRGLLMKDFEKHSNIHGQF